MYWLALLEEADKINEKKHKILEEIFEQINWRLLPYIKTYKTKRDAQAEAPSINKPVLYQVRGSPSLSMSSLTAAFTVTQ